MAERALESLLAERQNIPSAWRIGMIDWFAFLIGAAAASVNLRNLTIRNPGK